MDMSLYTALCPICKGAYRSVREMNNGDLKLLCTCGWEKKVWIQMNYNQ